MSGIIGRFDQIRANDECYRSLKAHKNGILRWFTTRITNGLLEGINSLVQASKRKARGYRSVENFIAM
ncbi:transposase [Anaerobacillus sp. HL2]|nr:transposase [Anaerobacillus sp. HL2]